MIEQLYKDLGISIVQATPVGQHFPLLTNLLPNLFAVGCVFVIEKKAEKFLHLFSCGNIL